MEPIDPVYGTATLLLIAAAAVALLLVLIMGLKLHAFISLVLVSVVTAIAVGFEFAEIPDVLLYGFADTIGSVALLVAFGVMLGRLLEVTGGAQVLADTLIGRFGEKRAPFALGVAALIFGFPIFFDAGLVVFLPIILTVARRFGGSLLYYALPAAGGFAAMHAIVPPHPGPVAAAEQINADIGLTLLVGLPIAVLAWYVGVYLVSKFLGARIDVSVANVVFGKVDEDHDGVDDDSFGKRPPAFGTVLGLLLIPLVLISFDTILDTLVTTGTLEEAGWIDFLSLIGQTPIALLITVLAAIFVLGRPNASMARITTILDQALGPICAIILITGAGGMFGGVLELSGIGAALSSSLSDLGFSLILQAFVIATLLRVAQGSATVALTTTGGLMAGPVAAAEPRRRPADADRRRDRRRRDRAVPRQRLGLLAGQPVLRHGREDHAEDLDRHGDHPRALGLRDRRRTLGGVVTLHLVFMGVSGSGKTTAAQALQELLGWEYAEGDDFHPESNVAKMEAGHPLTDADRTPWLRSLADWARDHDSAGRPTIMTCSALRWPYREILRERRGADVLRPPRRRQGDAARADVGPRPLHAAQPPRVAARHPRAAAPRRGRHDRRQSRTRRRGSRGWSSPSSTSPDARLPPVRPTPVVPDLRVVHVSVGRPKCRVRRDAQPRASSGRPRRPGRTTRWCVRGGRSARRGSRACR